MDISHLTIAELQALIDQATELLHQRAQERVETEQELNARVASAVQEIELLIGPASPSTADMASINEMKLYTDADFQQHSGIAIRLLLEGLSILAEATLPLARIQSRNLT